MIFCKRPTSLFEMRSMDLQIETTNKCQCACTFCVRPLDPPRPASVIEDDVFDAIVLSAKEMNIQRVYLTGLGDPFFDPKLEKRISFVKKHHPRSVVSIYTNGIEANPERLESCVMNGLDECYFSLNAGTPEMYEQIMGVKGKFEIVGQNLKYALNLNLKVIISVVLGMQYLEVGEYDKILEQWPNDLLHGHTVGNWAGRVFRLNYIPNTNHCRWFKEQMYFNLMGDLCLCCFDPYGKFGFGNIFDSGQTTVRGLWFGKKREEFLRRLETDGRGKIVPCSGCTTI